MKVLHLEDDPLDAELTLIHCRETWPDCELVRVDQREEFLSNLQNGDVDIILSDSGVPSLGGLEALRLAREISPKIPFVFLCGMMSETRERDVRAAGADALVSKDCPELLVPTMKRTLGRE